MAAYGLWHIARSAMRGTCPRHLTSASARNSAQARRWRMRPRRCGLDPHSRSSCHPRPISSPAKPPETLAPGFEATNPHSIGFSIYGWTLDLPDSAEVWSLQSGVFGHAHSRVRASVCGPPIGESPRPANDSNVTLRAGFSVDEPPRQFGVVFGLRLAASATDLSLARSTGVRGLSYRPHPFPRWRSSLTWPRTIFRPVSRRA